MEAIESLRWVGISMMILVCTGGLYALITQYKSVHSSISYSIAQNKNLYILMGILLSIGGGLFYLFLAFWLMPHYAIQPIGYLILITAFVAQLGLAWIPLDRKRRKLELAHVVGGGTVSICMILFLTLVSLTATNLNSTVAVILTIYLLACYPYLLFFLFFKKHRYRYFLLFESFFVGGFGVICILLATIT